MNRKIATRIFLISILAILLIWSISASVLWFKESNENRNTYLQQINDFHEGLIILNITMDNLLEITNTIGENNLLDQEQKLLALAAKNVRGDLERTYSRIRSLESRIDPTNKTFSKDYSIPELLAVIQKINAVTMEILENQPVDEARLNRLNEMLSSTSDELDFIYTVPFDSTDFQNKLKHYIDSVSAYLDKI